MAAGRGLHGRRRGTRASLTLTSLALAGCASLSPPQPFQAMKATTDMTYGYRETKIDPMHYSVVYAGDNEQLAQAYLEQRAAQLSRDAGFAYFAFDERGVQVFRRRDNELVMRDSVLTGKVGAKVNDFVPDRQVMSTTTYYYAFGQIALLSPAQAQGNADALQVNAVLARPEAAAR